VGTLSESGSTPSRDNPPRGGNGKFTARLDTAERDAEAARMRAQSKTYQEIADALGYADKGAAYYGVDRALKAVVREPAENLRKLQRARLDEMRVVARKVMLSTHYAHSAGRLILSPTGEDGAPKPLVDDMPKLAAVDRLLRIEEREAKLEGTDAPTKFENLSAEAVLAEIARVEAEIARGEAEIARGESAP
jgi:hypothetical protein